MTTPSISSTSFIDHISARVISGGSLSFQQALRLSELTSEADIKYLSLTANKVRALKCGGAADLCSIVNARSGNCPNDCTFCAQSEKNGVSSVVFGMRTQEQIVYSARVAEKSGAHRFCIVTSGVRTNRSDLSSVAAAIRAITASTSLKTCASLGSLDEESALILRSAGLVRYHHNLETSSSYFPNVCTIGSYDQKVSTLRAAKAAGLEICCGGILGLGESPEQRIELAFEIKELAPDSVPINFLRPIKGTALQDAPVLDQLQALTYIAIFRLIMPNVTIRLGAGRDLVFGDSVDQAVEGGVNGLLIGDYLTTKGPDVRKDLEMLAASGFSF